MGSSLAARLRLKEAEECFQEALASKRRRPGKKSGKSEIITLTPEQDAAMRKALEPVYQDVAKRVGQPLIDEFLKETRGATN